MRAGGGKQKGAAFEREVCVKLSRWLTQGMNDSCFWRSAMSGGRATVRHAKGKSVDGHGGDLTATDPRAHAFTKVFSIECKHVANLNLQRALIEGAGPLAEFWQQASLDAVRADKHPLLIAKQNRLPTLIFIRESIGAKYFGMLSQIECGRFSKLEGYRVAAYKFDELLETFPYERDRYR